MDEDINEKLDELDFLDRHTVITEKWYLTGTPFAVCLYFYFATDKAPSILWTETYLNDNLHSRNFIKFEDILLRIPDHLQVKLLFNIDLFV